MEDAGLIFSHGFLDGEEFLHKELEINVRLHQPNGFVEWQCATQLGADLSNCIGHKERLS